MASSGEDNTSTAAGCRLLERPASSRQRWLVNNNNHHQSQHNLAVFTWGRGSDGQLGCTCVVFFLNSIFDSIMFLFCSCQKKHAYTNHHCVFIIVLVPFCYYDGWIHTCCTVGDTANQEIPCFVDALQHVGVRHIACGSGHTVVLSNAGEIYSVGRGDDGRLGHGDNGWKCTFILLLFWDEIIIGCGYGCVPFGDIYCSTTVSLILCQCSFILFIPHRHSPLVSGLDGSQHYGDYMWELPHGGRDEYG
jgi:Regulator of chromosome condensation (RCC1) repeat